MRSIHRVVLVTAASAAFVVPAAAPAKPADLRSPDARDAAGSPLRQPVQDLRSPDARDSAHGVSPSAPVASPVTVIRTAGEGFDWGDAGIGAGGVLAVVMLGTGGVLLAGQRRGSRSSPLAH